MILTPSVRLRRPFCAVLGRFCLWKRRLHKTNIDVGIGVIHRLLAHVQLENAVLINRFATAWHDLVSEPDRLRFIVRESF